MNIARFCIPLLFAAMFLSGCGSDDSVPGVIATVNGKPITLGNVEFRYDLKHIESGDVKNPTVEQLRTEYGDITTDLIIQELIYQELTKAGQEVSDAELQAAEDQVRGDYPGDLFEQMLVEENIDLDRWREGVRARLAVEKFFDMILKPKVTVKVQEAADYYKEHLAEFKRPEKISFILAYAPDAAEVKALLKDLGSNPDPANLPEPKEGVGARLISLRPENLPQSWEKALKGLKRGEASKTIPGDMGYEALVFLEDVPGKTLDAAQAYPLVEERILKQKLSEAFSAWLKEALGNAKIMVSSRLMETGTNAEGQGRTASEEDFKSLLPLQANGEDAFGIDDQIRRTVADKMRQEGGDGEDAALSNGESAMESDKVPAENGAAGEVAETPQQKDEVGQAAGQEDDAVEAAAPAENAARETVKAETATDKTPEQETAPEASSVAADGDAARDAGQDASAVETPAPEASAEANVAAQEPGEVAFTANKASWIILTADDGKEEKIYVKGGKTHTAAFNKTLKVRLGSPSDVTYRYKGRETHVVSSSKEVKTLEFPQ